MSEEDKKQLYDYQMANLYNREKYYNPHNVVGVQGLAKAQTTLLDKKKVQYRVNNEAYLRKHPELENMISVFLFKVLEEKPKDILAYAGKYFDQPDLKSIIEIESKHYNTSSWWPFKFISYSIA